MGVAPLVAILLAALTPDELRTAKASMSMGPGADTSLTVISSGRRAAGHPMPAYAIFASRAQRLSDGVRQRRRVVCNLWSADNLWRCSNPHRYYQIGRHGFSHRGEGPADAMLLREIVGYYDSACFRGQVRAVSSGKAPAETAAIEDVEQGAERLVLRTRMATQPNSYAVRRRGGACRFELEEMRLGNGASYPER